MKSPVQKLSLDEIEQRAAYEIACGDVGGTTQYPVNAYQVLEALQVSPVVLFFCYVQITILLHEFTVAQHFPCFKKSG
jgi:hypothetical protein